MEWHNKASLVVAAIGIAVSLAIYLLDRNPVLGYVVLAGAALAGLWLLTTYPRKRAPRRVGTAKVRSREPKEATPDSEDQPDEPLTWRTWIATIATAIGVLLPGLAFLMFLAPGLFLPPERAMLGEPAEDGEYVFTVHSFECGLQRLPSVFPTRPRGQYCAAELSVLNQEDEARYPLGDWYLFVGDPRYSVADASGDAFSNDIFPGESSRGTLVFDIPKGSDPTELELYADFQTRGIVVPV